MTNIKQKGTTIHIDNDAWYYLANNRKYKREPNWEVIKRIFTEHKQAQNQKKAEP